MRIIFYFCFTLYITSSCSQIINIAPSPLHIRRARSPVRKWLINEPECEDLKSWCSHVKSQDDLFVLECVQTFQSSQIESLTEACQHLIWTRTSEIMEDQNVTEIIKKSCGKKLEAFSGCQAIDHRLGGYLACVIDKAEEVKDSVSCTHMIQRLESIAFTDFRLLETFMKDCANDIDTQRCGRITTGVKVSQGETVACLQENIEELGQICKKRILRLAEQQAENVKLDRQFFLACSKDADRFCPNEIPESSGIYKCLLRNKNSPNLSIKCREQIIRRDKLLARDYKVSRSLAKACREDIREYHCRRGVSEDKNVRLAQILLCLEAVIKNGTKLNDECRAEIDDHRKMLMADYQLSPEILSGCADDIPKFCGALSEADGEIIHCLMEHARPNRKKGRRMTSTCQRAIEDLIKVSDVGEDWRVDPVLRRGCKPVVDVACRDTTGGDARVMSCLMENIGTQFMTRECESALMLIQYFIARDFKLDPQLYRHCREDAVKHCKAKKTWADVTNNQMDPERGPLILPCLHRLAYSGDSRLELNTDCFQEVKRVMRQRAISVDLMPEVEDACLDDLATFCFDKTAKGAEMQCLQDNIEKLKTKCREVVTSYTEEEAEHVELNPVIMSVCREAMHNYCQHVLKKTKEQGEMMECLISHKNDPDMRQDLKCRAAIEHFQIISLKNFHFTFKFKEACRPYVGRFCATSTTKYDVVACLSEVMRNDTIRGQRHSIPKECRQQVKSQLYQQRENIDFDPKLKNACKKEIAELCSDISHGGGQVLECLQMNGPRLGDSCRRVLFNVKKTELEDSATDYILVNACKDMTFKYCHDTKTNKLLDCLKQYKDEPLFDPKCHLVVVNRMIEQNSDYRFNSDLQSACGRNIAQYCSHVVAAAKPNEELNGNVTNCLKAKLREKERRLDYECEQKIIAILHEQALNYKLNPILQHFCKSEIQILCHPGNEIEEHGEVEECLKNAFLEQRIITKECRIEVATLIQEAKADIHVDPLLQRACTVDLLRYCPNVKSGNGRKLKCLQVILQDESKAMEEDCKNKLVKRIEMFRNAEMLLAAPPENMEQLFSQVVSSPAKKYFFLVILTLVGFIFFFGLLCGRVTKRAIALKNK